jgi:hypothetical protein
MKVGRLSLRLPTCLNRQLMNSPGTTCNCDVDNARWWRAMNERKARRRRSKTVPSLTRERRKVRRAHLFLQRGRWSWSSRSTPRPHHTSCSLQQGGAVSAHSRTPVPLKHQSRHSSYQLSSSNHRPSRPRRHACPRSVARRCRYLRMSTFTSSKPRSLRRVPESAVLRKAPQSISRALSASCLCPSPHT